MNTRVSGSQQRRWQQRSEANYMCLSGTHTNVTANAPDSRSQSQFISKSREQ